MGYKGDNIYMWDSDDYGDDQEGINDLGMDKHYRMSEYRGSGIVLSGGSGEGYRWEQTLSKY